MAAEKIKDFEDLLVWRRSHELVLEIYQLTKTFPSEEKFGLVSQMRRAAISVPANIAEGFKRRGARNKQQFYNMSQTSLEEVRYYLILCRDLGYIKEIERLNDKCQEIARMLVGLIRSLDG